MLKNGYSRKTVEYNIEEYLKDGLDSDRAREAALKFARKWHKKKFPGKKMPDYLEGA